MKFRLMGLPGEVSKVVKALEQTRVFDVLEVSEPRANHGNSRLVRVYVEVSLTEWCDRDFHDGTCCSASRKEWAVICQKPGSDKDNDQ